MSFSKPDERLQRPASRYVEYKGGEGVFQYWDKDLKENVVIPEKEMVFAVLDKDLFSISGFSEQYGTGIYSNEVKSVEDILTVKVFDKARTLIAKGKYADVKDAAKGIGGKYTKCIYIKPKGINEIWHLKLSGAAFQSWIEHVDGASHNALTQYYVSISGFEDGKKGAVKFKKPIFELEKKITKKDIEQCIELDENVLQPYLEKYLASDGPDDAHAGGANSPEAGEEINTDDWRQFKIPGSQIRLCELGFESLKEHQERLESNEDVAGPLYQMVCRGLHEFQKAQDTWKTATTPKGTKLGTLGLNDLRELLGFIDKKNPANELRVPVLVGISATELEGSGDDDGDDIPF